MVVPPPPARSRGLLVVVVPRPAPNGRPRPPVKPRRRPFPRRRRDEPAGLVVPRPPRLPRRRPRPGQDAGRASRPPTAVALAAETVVVAGRRPTPWMPPRGTYWTSRFATYQTCATPSSSRGRRTGYRCSGNIPARRVTASRASTGNSTTPSSSTCWGWNTRQSSCSGSGRATSWWGCSSSTYYRATRW